ncbi:MAG TPA: hypothetical protein VFC47_03700 [Caulobacteraceae bacterium]|nr:hypothetical protein [Caulobacteraceae bacterium]
MDIDFFLMVALCKNGAPIRRFPGAAALRGIALPDYVVQWGPAEASGSVK